MAYILAIDQGTTSSRAIVYDQNKKVICKAQRPLELCFPQPGWVEVDANVLWQSVAAVINEVILCPDIEPGQIKGIAITNQRETTVVWDKKTGNPIANAIVWQSRQTADICKNLREAGKGELVRRKTGLPIDPYFSAGKIRFILDAVPGAQLRAERGDLLFGTVDTWLIWKLTGGKAHLTDYSNASRTMLFNIIKKRWDSELLALFNVPEKMLPEVCPSAGDFGIAAGGFLHGGKITVRSVLGDQQAALFGQNCLQEGAAKATFGTGGFLLMNTGLKPIVSNKGLLTTIAWNLGGETVYALEGSFFTAGSGVNWLIDSVRLLDDPGQADRLAMSASEDDKVFFIPALSGLGTPWWNDRVRGAFMGLTQAAGKAELARAVLESSVYQAETIFSLMQAESRIGLKEIKVDGGMVKSDFLLSFLSDILNIRINRPVDYEATALGVALLAGIEADMWDYDTLRTENALIDKTFEPHMDEEERAARIKEWQEAVAAIISYY